MYLLVLGRLFRFWVVFDCGVDLAVVSFVRGCSLLAHKENRLNLFAFYCHFASGQNQ